MRSLVNFEEPSLLPILLPIVPPAYMFSGKRPTRLNILWFQQNGYCLLSKRLHRAVFRMPKTMEPAASTVEVDLLELGKILEGIALSAKKRELRTAASFAA